MTLMYGGFPVKLTSYVGDPIYPTPGMTAEDLRDITVERMHGMIQQHQRVMPGSIVPAVTQNLSAKRKTVFNPKKLQHNKAYLMGKTFSLFSQLRQKHICVKTEVVASSEVAFTGVHGILGYTSLP